MSEATAPELSSQERWWIVRLGADVVLRVAATHQPEAVRRAEDVLRDASSFALEAEVLSLRVTGVDASPEE